MSLSKKGNLLFISCILCIIILGGMFFNMNPIGGAVNPNDKVEKVNSIQVNILEGKKPVVVSQKSEVNGIPNHGKYSSRENIITYRLHHNYRENYLKYKSDEVLSSYIYKKDTSEKKVYLTFDDGPYDNQKELVSYLTEKKIQATFFLLCSKINELNINAYRKDFFSIGMHTNIHQNYDNLTRDQILNDMDACNRKFDKHNLEKKIFRPAFGIVNQNQSEVLSLNNIDGIVWSMDSLDWEGVFNEQRIEEMLGSVSPGEIILFHENVNMDMFIRFITELEKRGFSFGKL